MTSKQIFSALFTILVSTPMFSQTIALPTPSRQGGVTIMEAFWNRHSSREYDSRMLTDVDLSDLLFAASGVNRPEEAKITAPTALNRQEILLYVFTPEAVYLYDKHTHALTAVAEGDHRSLVAGFQDFVTTAPMSCLLVADTAKFDDLGASATTMAAADAGIMAENIALFCAGRGLATVPRASMDHQGLRTLLGLSDKELPLLNLPVGYPKK